MFEGFGGILLMWVIIAVVASLANKAKKPSGKTAQSTASRPVRESKQPAKAAKPATSAYQPLQARQPLQTTLRAEHDHDHPGSLGDLHDEGFDPCHEDDLSPAEDPALSAIYSPQAETSGLDLRWTANDLVKGFVMSEVLGKRK